jgi:hypothetical protein
LAVGLLAVVVVVGSVVLIGRQILPSRVYWTQPDMARMTRDVSSLSRVLAVLEEGHVVAFRNQDWCRNISYEGGSFTTNTESTTCNLFDDTPASFTTQANADFALVEDALNESGVWVMDVRETDYDGSGRMTHAEFDLVGAAWEFSRWSYVYDRGGPIPQDMPNKEIYTRIDSNWYFHWGDWM